MLVTMFIAITALALLAACSKNSITYDATTTNRANTDDEIDPSNPAYIESDPDHPLAALAAIQQRFPQSIPPASSDVNVVHGGQLHVALPRDTPFVGILNPVFWVDGSDAEITSWFSDSLFSITPARQFGQHGIVTYTYDIDAMTLTLTQVEDVYWHDGHPLTLDDLVFAIETISSAGYTAAGGHRFTENAQRIKGVWEFHRGEANYITGLVLSYDQRELTIHFNTFPPSILHFGVWNAPIPRHIFGNVDVADIPNHYHTRVSPIGFGPFIVQNIIPGESVYLVANENYWRGRPKLDSVVIRVAPREMVATLMLKGEFDIASWRLSDLDDFPNPPNFTYLGDIANSFGIFAFNLGYYYNYGEGGKVHPFKNPRMGDIRLRHAMAYAMDVDTVCQTLYSGLRFRASSVIPPAHSTFLDRDLVGFPFDPERANQLLDEAGFYWPQGEEFRLDQDGNPFEIYLAIGIDQINEIMGMHYAQNWADVGLNVHTSFRDFTNDISPNHLRYIGIREPFDITFVNWTAGADPNPNSFWGHSINNVPRYVNPRILEALQGFNSPQAWDMEWLVGHYHYWQSLYNEYLPAIVTDWRVNLHAVNNRVVNYSPFNIYEDGLRTRGGLHRIQLTSEYRYK